MVADPTAAKDVLLQAARVRLIDNVAYAQPGGSARFSYAHPNFWSPLALFGDSATIGRPASRLSDADQASN